MYSLELPHQSSSNEYTQHTIIVKKIKKKKKKIPELSPFSSWPSVMINPQLLELPISRTNFHGPKDVWAIKVRLYLHENICSGYSLEVPWHGASNEYLQHMFLWRNKRNRSKFCWNQCLIWRLVRQWELDLCLVVWAVFAYCKKHFLLKWVM